MNTIRKGNQLVIRFSKEMFPCQSGLCTVEKINSKTLFMVTDRSGQNIILDLSEHGKTYTIQSVHSFDSIAV